MTFYIYPCRVNAPDYTQAQEAVVALLAAKSLRPIGEPTPRPCWPQYGEGTLWQAYVICEVSNGT